MLRSVPPRGGSVVFACAILLAVATGPHAARAAEISWERAGPFEACLAAGLEKWLDAQVDFLTNEDPAAWRIDDAAVAGWSIDVLASCQAKAGGGDQATEARFTKHMAHWRRHIYDRVESVRQTARPD